MPLPLNDISNFTPTASTSVKSEARHSHKISRGTLAGSKKIWIKKEMLDPVVAKIEILAQEFFRLIIPYQPETRLLINYTTGTHHILSEEVEDYRHLPKEPAKYENGTYTGLGQVLITSAFLQEIDLKIGNIGLDNQRRVNKIDGDWCFAEVHFGKSTYNLTPEMIAHLPYPRDFYAFNWIDLIKEEVKHLTSGIVSPTLTNSLQFRNEVNQAILKICIIPDRFIECFVDAFMPSGAHRFIHLIKARREELLVSAKKNVSFVNYLKSPKAQTDANQLITQITSFVAHGINKIVPDSELLETQFQVQERFNKLTRADKLATADLVEKTKIITTENHRLLDEILASKVNDYDLLILNFVAKKRNQLSLTSTIIELSDLQKELNEIKNSVTSPQVQAVKNAVQMFRNTTHWWTVGKEKKAQRIEQALINTPIEERGHVITAKGAATKVQEALAAHRHWGHRGAVYKNDTNEINLTKAAKTFKDLHHRFFSEGLAPYTVPIKKEKITYTRP